ncbi:MAG: ribonuclease T2 [Pseudomonadota bacterium]
MRLLLALLLVTLGLRSPAADTPGDFDFYVLALSWSPSYCASVAPGRSPLQCDSGRPFAFVVHGLWPQYERGWPADCIEPAPRLSQAAVQGMLDIMPAAGLVRHQWRKHGTCSGLPAEAYFELTRRAFDSVAIPDALQRLEEPLVTSTRALEAAFLEANPDIPADGISARCRDRRLQELRICFTRELTPRSCEQVERRQCREDSVLLPPVR